MKFWVVTLIFGLLVVSLTQSRFPQQRLADQIVFEFNENMTSYSADMLRFMSFGYSRAMGALIWLRFLQQTPTKKVGKNQVSWIYHDLDAITEIDPYFYPAYSHGGIFLSVITEDKRGAEQILYKGTKVFPDRWHLHAYLAYHYQWELDEQEKAYEQYKIAAKLPGAPYLMALIVSSYLNSKEGRESGIHFLEAMLKESDNPEIRKKLEEKIEKLRKGDNGGFGNFHKSSK